jgi:hypothetical protein
MSKLFDNIFKESNKGPVDDKERLCDNICSTLTTIIDDRRITKDKRLIVWLECEKQIVFDQYNNEDYRRLLLISLTQKGFEFKQVVFEMGKPAEDNHNVFKIKDNDHEYLEVKDCENVQQTTAGKKAKIVVVEGQCLIKPLQKEYVLSSEEITSGRIPAYNIGRGQFVQKNGGFRENHIIFDDNPDSPLRNEYRCISRDHAHIGFDPKDGFFFQVDAGGAFPGKTHLIWGGKEFGCDCVGADFPLTNGDKILFKYDEALKAMLLYEEINT